MRFIIKKTKQKNRGQEGTIEVFYVYDLVLKQACSPTSPIKDHVIKICSNLNNYYNRPVNTRSMPC